MTVFRYDMYIVSVSRLNKLLSVSGSDLDIFKNDVGQLLSLKLVYVQYNRYLNKHEYLYYGRFFMKL